MAKYLDLGLDEATPKPSEPVPQTTPTPAGAPPASAMAQGTSETAVTDQPVETPIDRLLSDCAKLL